jgi:hypothetical protein
VQVADRFDQFGCVDLGPLLRKSLLLSQISKELSSVEKVDDEVQLCCRLKCVVQGYYVWAFDSFQDISFSLGLYKKILLD